MTENMENVEESTQEDTVKEEGSEKVETLLFILNLIQIKRLYLKDSK